MPFPVQLLTTRAECDLVLAATGLELREFQVNEQVVDLRDDKKTSSAATRAQDLADTEAVIATLTPLVAGLPAGNAARFQNEQALRQATRRRENLTTLAPSAVPTGAAAILLALDVRQIQVQIPEIQACLAEVTAHRATLPA